MFRKAKRLRSYAGIVISFVVFCCAGWRVVEAQAALTCTASTPVPSTVRWEGLTERVADVLLNCSGGTPGVPLTANFQIFLNTNITANLLDNNPVPTTEALLLLNDPAPVLQILGANVFRGLKSAENAIIWPGVIFAPDSGGNVLFRLANLRANATALTPGVVPAPILAYVAVSGPSFIPIANPSQTVGFVIQGSNFWSSDWSPGFFNLNFQENYSTAFMKRIAVDASGIPLEQNDPGYVYSTESGFTTGFSLTDVTGRAASGTRLVARFKNLPTGTSLSVPLTVPSNNSALAARLLTRTEPDFSGGAPATLGILPICRQSAQAVYEITGPAGITGAFAIDTFTIPVTVLGAGFGGAVVNGNLGPISTVGVMSLEAPEPRFVDLALESFPLPSCVYLPTVK